MHATTPGKLVVRGRSWRRFFLLLGMFLAALFFVDLLPMGGWSDVRSKWLNAAADTAVCIIFFVAAVRAYYASGSLTGLQAILLCCVFGAVLVGATVGLVESIRFLQDLRNRHSGGAVGPNPWVQATPDYALCSFLGRWPGAPDPVR